MDARTTLRSAMTAGEVVVVICVVLIAFGAITLLLPSTSGPRELSKRTVCASNMKGIGTGMYTYANENADCWPVTTHPAPAADERGQVTYAPGKIGLHRDRPTTAQDKEISPTRSLWLLVRIGASSPKSFYCPNSDDSPNDEDNPQDFWDFHGWNETSYGYQVSFGRKGRPSSNCDQRMPLAADKGPFSAALEASKHNPGTPTPAFGDPPDNWRPWNSPNHGGFGDGEGQVVLFADSHAGFETKPLVGIKGDNIYTQWSTPDGGTDTDDTPRIHGKPPTGTETPMSNTDTLIYP